MITPSPAHSIAIPDSHLAKEATDILRGNATDLLFNHSMRVYLFAVEQGRQRQLRFDPELLYVAAAFHDLGLVRRFSSPDERFEVDGANAARQFLDAHGIAEDQVQAVWEAIALHTTPGIPKYMRPEVALLNSGVLLDVLGVGFDQFPVEVREEIVARYPMRGTPEYADLVPAFEEIAGARQIIRLSVDLVQTSCGLGVPLFDYRQERGGLARHWMAQGIDNLRRYWGLKNMRSIDGLPTGFAPDTMAPPS
ncbi:MAG: HD domain-containing protein [Pseudomonadota bacterium]